jgi:hypothetical protein
MSEWKTIDSAPVDGTAVIVYSGGVVGEARVPEYGGGWYWAGMDPTDYGAEPTFPSRWMPLPEPPQPDKEG